MKVEEGQIPAVEQAPLSAFTPTLRRWVLAKSGPFAVCPLLADRDWEADSQLTTLFADFIYGPAWRFNAPERSSVCATPWMSRSARSLRRWKTQCQAGEIAP